MATKTIPWTTGGGNIYVTPDSGNGSGVLSIGSDDNEGLDREQTLTVKSTDNKVSASLVVKQSGMREEFQTSDGEVFYTSGNKQFITLK